MYIKLSYLLVKNYQSQTHYYVKFTMACLFKTILHSRNEGKGVVNILLFYFLSYRKVLSISI